MEDLRWLMLTGRKVITENGDDFLVLRDVETFNYGHEDFVLISKNGFLVGSNYDVNLRHADYDKFNISSVYQDTRYDIGAETNFSLKDKDYLVWERKWQPKIGYMYWTVEFDESNLCYMYTYTNSKSDLLLKERGLIFKTKAEAQAKAKKMLKI